MAGWTQRRRAAAAVLVISCAALVATSPGPPTARADASGEIRVAPNEPGEVEVRFTVAPPPELDRIVRLSVQALVQGWGDPRLSASASAAVAGQPGGDFGLGDLELDPSACASGCEVVATIVVSWIGPPEPGLRTAWETELAAEYENRVPEMDPITASVVRGDEPALPRAGWPILGIGLAALAGVGLARQGDRWAIPRLLLAAGVAVPPAVGLAWLAVVVWSLPPTVSMTFELETMIQAGAALALIAAVAIGLWRAARGSDSMLRVVGWLGALGIGLSWSQLVGLMGTYRASELTLVTLALAVPCAAAIGGAPPLGSRPRARSRVGAALSLVIAAQLIMAAVSVLIAGALIFSFVVGLLRPGAGAADLASVGIGLIPVLVAFGFIAGLWAWRRGSRGTLVAANVPVVLLVLAGTAWALLQPETGFLAPTPELRALALFALVVALAGMAGVLLLPPPVAAEPRGSEVGLGG